MGTPIRGSDAAEIERVTRLVATPIDVTSARRLPGAYRLHRPEDVRAYTDLACAAFPNFTGRIACFGVDWLGRQFATDLQRSHEGEPLVLRLEPGTGGVAEIPATIASFHHHELVRFAHDVIAYSYFKDWQVIGGGAPAYDQCVGYKVPLYLGAPDNVTNLERVDLAGYWRTAAGSLAEARQAQARQTERWRWPRLRRKIAH